MGCSRSVVLIAGLLTAVIQFAEIANAQVNATAASDEKTSTAVATAAAEQQFDVFELRVLGNTKLPQSDIESALYPYLGYHKTLQDVEIARKALEALYHDRGYGTVYVDIPDQTVDSGVVRLKVTEAKLRRVQVTGARYFSNRQIKAGISEAKEGSVPSLPKLQAQITELNTQSRDRTVVPVLKAGATPGTVDLSLKVDDHLPLHASLEVNNQYTADTKPLRAIAGLTYDNLFADFDSIGVQYQTAPQNRSEVDVWMGSYTTHVFDADTRLALFYVNSNSAVATLGSGDAKVTVLGKGKDAGVRLIHPLSGAGNSLGSITASVDYKDFLQNICTDADTATCNTTGFITPINYFNFSVGYSGGWRSDRRQSTFSLSSNFGVRGLRNDPADFENKRFKAGPNYIDFRSDGLVLFKLPAQFNVQLRYSGQYAFDPLISNEQFSLAGVDGVRAYLESEELGDRGIKATVQFGSPQWKLFKSTLLTDAFVFYDYGTAQLLEPLLSEKSSIALESTGLGLNLSAFDHFSGTLFWAHALSDGNQTKRGDSRYQFSVRATW